MNYRQAIEYLESFIGKIVFNVKSSEDPLERMRVFLNLLGNPQNKFKSILVGGTSGKGSTAYLISHILIQAGYKTGLTISPHLQKVNERIQINGQLISDMKFTKIVNSIVQTITLMKTTKVGAPSYFEILIGMVFKYFADQKVDIAVVEVGMGGEFDATNTLSPLIAVLTNVGLDHTNILGKTVEKIARTKAGIIKKGERGKGKGENILHASPFTLHPIVISGIKQPSVIKIIEKRCEETRSKLSLLWRDFGYKIKKENIEGTNFDFISHEETLDGLQLSLLGQYQAENASLAIKTILELRKLGFNIIDEVIKKALKTAFFPGRFEVITYTLDAKRYTLVLDGAHNPTKMKEFLKSLKKIFPKERKVFIIGFKFDKDIPNMLRQITQVADEIIITEFRAKTDVALHASADAPKIKNQISNLKYEGKIFVEKDSEKALKRAFEMRPELVVATGSLYLVGEIRDLVE